MSDIKDWSRYRPYFAASEFNCKCGCGKNNMSQAFMDILHTARHDAQIPFIIKSGCRCELNNQLAGGTDTSDHLSGEGADILCLNSSDRFKILRAAFKVGFTRIGIHPMFIHLGYKNHNPQEVVWIY